MQLYTDRSQRVVVPTANLPWIHSPEFGVDRRPLERDSGEVARATSIVRYRPHSHFSKHEHAMGEEFLVLDSVFSDHLGDYAQGTYVRNRGEVTMLLSQLKVASFL